MNKIARFDWYSMLLFLALVSVGLLNIYSAAYNVDNVGLANTIVQKQFISLLIGGGFIFILQFIDVKFFERYASIIYVISLASLAGLWLFGSKISGAQSWYAIGGFSLQPSEFAKVAAALAVAKHLGSFNTKIQRSKDYLVAFILIGIPAVLVLLQPDPGTALILLSLFLVLHAEGLPNFFILVLLSASLLFVLTLLIGVSWVYVLITLSLIMYLTSQKKRKRKTLFFKAFLIALISIGFTYSVSYIFEEVFEQRHRDRFNILLGKEVDSQGIGYNINQSQIAIGSGRFSGKGYLQGTQTKGGFVPEQQTDYIFTTIGEEWGFMGTITIITLFILLMLRILHVAYKQKSTFSRVFCLGFVCTLFIHVTVNIGMVVGLIPTIGIPLPFISYGGSSLLAFCLFLGIYLRMEYQRTL
ncbi:MAG: rod shape-determining protein RodA [Flavobacteriaceae bacterium]|nr:rod shape-determining protein RodA [Flavobacteriaceae bacterium]